MGAWTRPSSTAPAGAPVDDRESLEQVVATNDKPRYEFDAAGTRIRAHQGHSVDVDLQLVPQQSPALLFHGTADRFVPAILADGLRPGSRRHVHLSANGVWLADAVPAAYLGRS